MKKLIRLALFDDDPFRRELLGSYLQSSGRYRVAAGHALTETAAQQIDRNVVDGVILVVDAMSRNELALGDALRRRLGSVPIVICTTRLAAWKTLERLMKTSTTGLAWRPEICVGAICDGARLLRFLASLYHLDNTVGALQPGAARMKQAMATLSPREREVFRFARTGMTYKEISVQLGISRKSVATYSCRMCEKLGLSGIRALSIVIAGKH